MTKKKQETKTIVGTAKVNMSAIFRYLSNQVGSASVALREYLDNSKDANATLIVVGLYPDRVEIFDNGHGMVPEWNVEQREYFELYIQDVDNGIIPDSDIRDLMSPAGGCSFPWLMECIALSFKQPEKGAKTIGMRGIGTLAFRHIGNTPTWYSKPAAFLAEEFYADFPASAANPPVCVLHAPTAEALDRNDKTYKIETTLSTKLVDPFGKAHPSGTKIVITGLVPDIGNALRPTLLAEEFRKRYGSDIRDGKLKIQILDQLTAEGRKTPNGRIIDVEPLTYRGALVYSEMMSLRGAPFAVELYYDSSGRNHKVGIRRAGVNNFDQEDSLTSIKGLNIEPFNSGKLSGFVELPGLPESIFPLNPAKTAPIESPALGEFVKQIRSIKRVVEAKIEEIEERASDRTTSAALKEISDIAMAGIREIDILSNLLEVTATPPPGGTRTPRVPKTISAHVFDEHSIGLSGVQVELYRNGKVVKTESTKAMGHASLGKFEPGVYVVRVVVPSGMKIRKGSPDRFGPTTTTDERPGFVARFHLETGKPVTDKPERRSITGKIQIIRKPLDDETLMYSADRLEFGQIQINSESVEYRRAVESGDEELRDGIIITCAAQAIVEYTLRDHPEFERGQITTMLTAKLFRLRRTNRK